MSNNKKKIQANLDWETIETVLLDMDGTLLDKYFDDFFWEHYVPETYANKNKVSVEEAKKELLAHYKSKEGTLEWTDLDFWSEKLGLDIPALKIQVDHLIQIHPYVVDFLRYCQKINKKIHLVTNAHSKTLDIKMRKTAIGQYFDSIVCSQDVGMAKEQKQFWEKLQDMLQFDPSKTMLADDTEEVLRSAKDYGLNTLIYVAKPSSKSPVKYSNKFPSILYFNELIV